jgi:6-phosphogluconolactonase
MIPEPVVDISADPADLADRVAIWLATRIAFATRRIVFNLSGGTTPRDVYELLGGEDLRSRIDWHKVHLFFGDERFVPADHPDSNFRMAFEAMIRHVPIPASQVYPVPTDVASPDESAALYTETLQNFYGSKMLDPAHPLFDVTLLGLGTDGHIASLFPGSEALGRRDAWVLPVHEGKPHARVTMSLPVLESSGIIVFLVSGAHKREVLTRLLANDPSLPASRLETRGTIMIFADRAAAMG